MPTKPQKNSEEKSSIVLLNEVLSSKQIKIKLDASEECIKSFSAPVNAIKEKIASINKDAKEKIQKAIELKEAQEKKIVQKEKKDESQKIEEKMVVDSNNANKVELVEKTTVENKESNKLETPTNIEKVEKIVEDKPNTVVEEKVVQEKKPTPMPSFIKGVVSSIAKTQPSFTRERKFDKNNQTQKTNSTGSRVLGVMGPSKSTRSSVSGGGFRTASGTGAARTSQGGRGVGFARPIAPPPPPSSTSSRGKGFDKKKDFRGNESGSKMNKRTLIRKGIIDDQSEMRYGIRKLKNKKQKNTERYIAPKLEKAIITTENLTVKILSEKIGKTVPEILKQLMKLEIMANINSVVDFETMELVASELGVAIELKLDKSKEEELTEFHDSTQDLIEDLVERPPVITVMGHVDHGKTSLLDAIRKTSVVAGESGGITQHIGAYTVETDSGRAITFLDTPGHEAFIAMRARGAKVTDIAVLVVAADDGIMPQTIESINHAKAANVPIIVAINKIDKPGANPKKIIERLTEFGIVVEEWGGDTMVAEVSAKKGIGILGKGGLLDKITLLADVNGYKANPKRSARGAIVEAKLDKGKGPVASIIVQNGTLHTGDVVVSGNTYGRIRAMTDCYGKSIKQALPSTAVSVLGFNDVPQAGDGIFVVDDEKLAKQVVAERNFKFRNEQALVSKSTSVDDMFVRMSQSMLKNLNIVIKADVQGSVEALKTSLLACSNDEVRVNIVHCGVGTISKSDMMLAEVSKAIIIGFHVKMDSESKIISEKSNIDVRLFKVIYEAIDDIKRAVKGLEKPIYKDIILGRAQVRNVFKLSSNGTIAGSYVLTGKIVRNAKARVYRGKDIVFEGEISSLKRFKEDVKEVGHTYECGISISGYIDYKVDDEIECYNQEQINL